MQIDERELPRLAQRLKPYLSLSTGSGSAGGALSAHELNGPYHTGQLAQSQATWATPLTTYNTHVSSAGDPHTQYVLETTTLTAGAGLTGGGTLAANRTFAVGAGAGITVNADDVALASSVAGNGLTYNTGVLAVGVSGLGLGVGADAVTLTSSSNPGAAASILASNASGGVTLVNVTATADLTTDRVAGHLIPKLTDTYDLGTSTLLWRKGWLSELDTILFAQNTITLLGGWFYVTPNAGVFPSNVTSGMTAIDFGKTLTVGSFIEVRTSLYLEHMQVTSYSGSGFVYNVSRDLDGTGANDWVAGTPYAVHGTNGQGRIEFNAYNRPRIQLVTQGATYNAKTEIARLGDLDGNYGYTAENYGFALGEYASGKPNITLDLTNGLRFRTHSTVKMQIDGSGSMYLTGVLRLGTSGELRQGTTTNAGDDLDGAFSGLTNFTGLRMWRESNVGRIAGYNGGTEQVGFDTNGRFSAGGGKATLDADGLTFNVSDTLPYMRVVDSTATYPERVRWLNWTALSGTLTYTRWSAMGGTSEIASVQMAATDAGVGAVSLSALGASGAIVLSATGTTVDGTLTVTGATTANGNVVISKSSPALNLTPTGGVPAILTLTGIDNGSSIGARIVIDRNSNASTPAAGHLYLVDKGNQGYRIWPDDSGVLRIHTGDPTYANDSAGTVVGAQTSNLASKDIQGDVLPIEQVLASVRQGAEAVRRFVYKDGRFGGEAFEGVVVDWAPRYGMDNWRSLNEVTVIGDLLRAVDWLVQRELGRM